MEHRTDKSYLKETSIGKPVNHLALPDLQLACDLRTRIAYKMGSDIPISYWGMAMMGEAGELCNLLAKVERVNSGGLDGGNSITAEEITDEKIAEEMGGLLIYLSILAYRLGINLEEAVRYTFNQKSIKIGYPVTI